MTCRDCTHKLTEHGLGNVFYCNFFDAYIHNNNLDKLDSCPGHKTKRKNNK